MCQCGNRPALMQGSENSQLQAPFYVEMKHALLPNKGHALDCTRRRGCFSKLPQM